MHTRVLDHDGVEIVYDVYGSDDTSAVVLLHALGRSADDWRAVAEALSRWHHVVVPDLRGHGRSGRPGAYSFELMRDEVLALLDHLDVGSVAVVGHSMGGTVAYLVAEARPDLVCCLVLEDTPVPRGADIPEPPAEAPFPVPFDWPLVGALTRQLNRPDPAWWAELPAITASTLLVSGAPESPLDPQRQHDVADVLLDGRVVTVGGGHHVHETRPAEFIAVVERFLDLHRNHD